MAETEPQSLFVQHEGDEAAMRIAVRANGRAGDRCGVVWLGGFKSDMAGTKANALAQWADRRQRSFVRFDYSGHGESSGDFASGTIGRWRDEAREVLERYGMGPQILVGSSMGAWIALLLAQAEANKVGIR
ncbi:MAG TPA: alpha/beta hydrolase, partial [Hyphomicrobiales bacterium]|nr:alpha/beta hydrolase [Hyphomicrobiales bacterium]